MSATNASKIIDFEATKCLICHDAKCTKACPKGFDPARVLRALRFKNTVLAGSFVEKDVCINCEGFCEKECVHFDGNVKIKEVIENICESTADYDIDLGIEFVGIKCENPFFLSSSIVAGSYDMCKRALEMGWGGIVYKTIGFIKPSEVSPRYDTLPKDGVDFIGFRNLEQISERPLTENLDDLRRLKKEFPNKIIVASIMAIKYDEWTTLAKLCTEANVDIIECNFSCPHMTAHGLGSDVGVNPELVKDFTEAVRKGTNLPILAKMTPNLANIEIPAIVAINAGANGIAAINTIKSISGINLKGYDVFHEVHGQSSVSGYSGRAVKPIALRFIHDMAFNKDLCDVPLSAMGGIESWYDAAEFLAMGATNIQITTAVMQYGYRIIDDLILGMKSFLKTAGYKSMAEFVGSAKSIFTSGELLDRSTIVYPVIDYKKCVGCGRCYISCLDGGHQAIIFNDNSPKINAKKCVGCHLCSLVCPVGAISKSKRIKKIV